MIHSQVRRRLSAAATVQADAAGQSYLRVPSRVELINRLIFDARLLGVELTLAGADAIVELWARARRSADDTAQHKAGGERQIETLLTGYEVEFCSHAMSRLMPDGVLAVPGSVHAVLNAFTFGVNPSNNWPLRGVMVTVDSIDGQAPVVIVV